MEIPDGLSFQIKVKPIDLSGRDVKLSKVSGFTLRYYVSSNNQFVASKQGVTLSNCVIEDEWIVVTVTHNFITKGVVKCRMDISIIDSVLPSQPFTFICPEQRTNIEIV